MRNILILTIGVLAFGFSSLSQEMGEKVINIMNECSCNEILMISGGFEKKYTGVWLENMRLENGFIEFSKGENRNVHRWNAEKVVFIEQGTSFIRVYLEQMK